MQKELVGLAKRIQILKRGDKEYFLKRLRNCAILFDVKNPQSIPSCPVGERLAYRIDLVRRLYRQLEGEMLSTPTQITRALADSAKLQKINEQEVRQKVISEGIQAYCDASNKDRDDFGKVVLKTNLLAPFLRKKDKVLDYDF